MGPGGVRGPGPAERTGEVRHVGSARSIGRSCVAHPGDAAPRRGGGRLRRPLLLGVRRGQQLQQGAGDLQRHRGRGRPRCRGLRGRHVLQRQPQLRSRPSTWSGRWPAGTCSCWRELWATTDPALLAAADQIDATEYWYNGDDAVVLRKGGAVVDVIGQVGFDPGSEWGSGPDQHAGQHHPAAPRRLRRRHQPQRLLRPGRGVGRLRPEHLRRPGRAHLRLPDPSRAGRPHHQRVLGRHGGGRLRVRRDPRGPEHRLTPGTPCWRSKGTTPRAMVEEVVGLGAPRTPTATC